MGDTNTPKSAMRGAPAPKAVDHEHRAELIHTPIKMWWEDIGQMTARVTGAHHGVQRNTMPAKAKCTTNGAYTHSVMHYSSDTQFRLLCDETSLQTAQADFPLLYSDCVPNIDTEPCFGPFSWTYRTTTK